MTQTIVLATNNRHKVEEFRQMASAAGLDGSITFVSMAEIGLDLQPDESGTTFEENAYLKAVAIHQATGLPCLADDSGLEVDILHGAPGVYSARYAGEDASDADNRARVARELQDREHSSSPAAFRCVICYVDSLRTIFAEGACTGVVHVQERGPHGFGYDPLFVADGDTQTFGELTAEEKHQRSHRGRAFATLIPQLQALWSASSEQPTSSSRHLRRTLLELSYAAACGNGALLDAVLARGIRTQEDAVAAYECLLQSYLFAGFPAALDSLGRLDDYWRAYSGASAWVSPERYNVDVFTTRGEELCKQVYGSVYPKMMARLDESSPDLRQWMIVEGYGKTLARAGLDTIHRELCNVVVLAVMGRQPQLVSHVRGALLVGATPNDLEDCLDVLIDYATPEVISMCTEVVHTVARRRHGSAN